MYHKYAIIKMDVHVMRTDHVRLGDQALAMAKGFLYSLSTQTKDEVHYLQLLGQPKTKIKRFYYKGSFFSFSPI